MRTSLLLLAAALVAGGCDSDSSGLSDDDLADIEARFGCSVEEIRAGQSASGSLTATCDDEDILDGEFADEEGDYWLDLYAFHLDSDAEVTIRVESDVFDTDVTLLTETGGFIKYNDDIDLLEDVNSRIIQDLDDGTYVIAVSSPYYEEGGSYTVRLDVDESARRASDAAPVVTKVAGVKARR